MILQRVDKLIEVHLLTQILMLQSLVRKNHYEINMYWWGSIHIPG